MIILALLCTYCKLSLQQICFYSTDTTWTVSITKLFVYYSKNARKYFAYFFIKKKEIYCNEKKMPKFWIWLLIYSKYVQKKMYKISWNLFMKKLAGYQKHIISRHFYIVLWLYGILKHIALFLKQHKTFIMHWYLLWNYKDKCFIYSVFFNTITITIF